MGHSGRGRGRRRARAVDSPPAPSAARFRFRERRPGFPATRTNQVWIFRFRFFSRVCREENFPARQSGDISAGRKLPGSTKVAGPSRQASDSFSVPFLINGLHGGKFPCHRIRRFGGEGEPPLREDVAAAERHLPQPVYRPETARPDHRMREPIASPSRAIRNRAKPAARGAQGPRAAEACESPETVRVRRMRDPEPHVRSPPPPRGRWRRSWTARKFRGGRGRNLGVRFLRGDGHEGSE
jgi:hypothetical protein